MSATDQELRDIFNGCTCRDCNPEIYDNIRELVQELLDGRAEIRVLRNANSVCKDRITELEAEIEEYRNHALERSERE